MLNDIVLDTNVLKHASDGRRPDQKAISKFFKKLQGSATKLCVDPGFDFESEASNTSHICSEYIARLVPGELGFELIRYLARTARITIVPRTLSVAKRKVIRNAIFDPSDRVFVQVAHNSSNKILTTHDETNFPKAVRKLLSDELGVETLSAVEADAVL